MALLGALRSYHYEEPFTKNEERFKKEWLLDCLDFFKTQQMTKKHISEHTDLKTEIWSVTHLCAIPKT